MLLFEHLSKWCTQDSSHAFISIIIDGMFERRKGENKSRQIYIYSKRKKPPCDTSRSLVHF